MAAKIIATQSGVVIGAASACGVASERTVAVWAAALSQASELSQGEIGDDELRKDHLSSVKLAAGRQQAAGPATCPASIKTFDELERRCVIDRIALCVTAPPPAPR